MSRLNRLLGFPRRSLQLLAGGVPRLDRLTEESRRGVKVGAEVLKKTDALRQKVDGLDQDIHALRDDVGTLRRELHDRMLQYHHQLGRLARAVDASHATDDVRLSGRSIPVETPAADEPPWSAIGDGCGPDPQDLQWQTLDACPACTHHQRTVVCPWNKFILLEKAPDASSVRYDYAVCHACGVLYASRRPIGDRYQFLLEHFGEVTSKRGSTGKITNRVLNPEPLTDADREELRRLAGRGVFVSDHLGLRKSDYLAPLLRDRFENSLHIDVIGSLLAPRGWRVLEVRSRAGTILDGLRRSWDAQVAAMPIWESQQFLLREVYGIETSDLIDFDRFSIPFDGAFDLIICNHMFTHVLRPADFFAELRARLKPGGHLYLHNEPDDAEFLEGKQSMLATLNPLHMQAFDPPSLSRALEANGFRTVFQKHQQNETQFCLAVDGAARLVPLTDQERDARVDAYRRAFDYAVLGADERARARLAGDWPRVVERAVASGVAEFDERGQLRLVAR
jgi:SAM-dependent methyltransferase